MSTRDNDDTIIWVIVVITIAILAIRELDAQARLAACYDREYEEVAEWAE